jgi:uncharacterized protein with von Willebrand factor type A (vWA) domain
MVASRLETGRLVDNVVHFGRILRGAGLPVGTDRLALALQALPLAGVDSRDRLHDALQACLVSRAEHRPIFEQAFRMFWRMPDLLSAFTDERLHSSDKAEIFEQKMSLRLLDAMVGNDYHEQQPVERVERTRVQVQPSASERERLRRMDFDSMTAAEYSAAQQAVEALEPLLLRFPTRRERPSKNGMRIDLHRLLRDAGRYGGDVASFPRRVRRTRTESLCVIVDISGSMSRYSRVFLHFMHAVMNGPRAASLRINAFVFGTRLTQITNLLKHADPDGAVADVCRYVQDWSGGTRIGSCLKEFNRRWARRLQLAGSSVLLVTDGLEHTQIALLAEEAERLARSCRRLLWLNPLLRYEAFEPKAQGVRALLPHVDRLLPVHNIESLQQLLAALSRTHGNER